MYESKGIARIYGVTYNHSASRSREGIQRTVQIFLPQQKTTKRKYRRIL